MSQGCFNVSLFLWHIWGFILCFVNIFVNRNKALFQHLALEIYCCANYIYLYPNILTGVEECIFVVWAVFSLFPVSTTTTLSFIWSVSSTFVLSVSGGSSRCLRCVLMKRNRSGCLWRWSPFIQKSSILHLHKWNDTEIFQHIQDSV